MERDKSGEELGKIEKAVGDVTAIRNGVAVTLHVGDAVYKSDVIQTGTGSSVGISFPDGTALNLVANTRMGLNDYNYNPSSNSNDALFTLVEGTFAFVAGKVAHNQFSIKTDKPNVEVSWQVTGIRQDAWANAHRIPVEEQKNARERGHYIHPELYGAPEESSIEWARHPQTMKRMKEMRQTQVRKVQTSTVLTPEKP